MTLSLENVGHRYLGSPRDSISDVSLSLKANERLAIIGESGSGKSTLLGIMAGLLAPSVGGASLNGQPISSIPPADRDIALTVQNAPHMPGVRVGELLLRPALRSGRHDARARVEAALVDVDMKDAFDRRLDTLSGGESQRCFLARTLVWQPKLILLDEPFNSLDTITKRAIIPRILAHQEAIGASLAIITHDAAEACLIAERYLLLHAGTVVSQGLTASAASDPQTTFGAAVFGGLEMNLVPGVLYSSQSGAELSLMGATFRGSFSGQMREKVVVALQAGTLELSNEGANPGPAIPIEEGVHWTPIRSGHFAVASLAFGPIYAHVPRPITNGCPAKLILRVKDVLLFDINSQSLVGTFSVRQS